MGPTPEAVFEAAKNIVSPFVVSFLKLAVRGNREHVTPAGTGTFVTIGKVQGILTASHVLHELPSVGEVDIGRFRSPHVQQREKLDLTKTDRLAIGEPEFKSTGPDLGLLKLHPTDAGSFGASSSYFNLAMRRDLALAGIQAGQRGFFMATGLIAERSRETIDHHDRSIRIDLHGSAEIGKVTSTVLHDGFDVLNFEPYSYPDCPPPKSYEGMSGGALWRVFCQEEEGGRLSVSDLMLWGVVFHQSPLFDGKRILHCHGPNSIYRTLFDQTIDRWPEAAAN